MSENILEYPGAPGLPAWDSLYRARGDEVQAHRSIFTGDVFVDVEVQSIGHTKRLSVMVLQHPCALRTDGVNLHPRLIVAEVREHRVLSAQEWTGNFRKMPLPQLIPTYEGFRNHDASRDQAALFNEIYLASPDALAAGTRIACLSQVGVNLVMQRWVNHNSRMVAPTWQYQEVASGPFDEADLIEDWCEERMYAGVGSADATVEAMKWLREDVNGALTRQQRLEDPQERSAVRSEMRRALRSMR
jgi:hypothetical protein